MCKPWIVLDCDGTILDVSRRHYELYRHLCEEFGLFPIDYCSYWKARREGKSNLLVMIATGLSSEDCPNAAARWLSLIESEEFLRHDKLYHGVYSWLTKARDCFRLALCSVRSRPLELYRQLSRLKLQQCFDVVLQVTHSPCQAESKAKAVIDNKIAPIAWIGDSEDDLRAAALLGVRAIAVTAGQRSREFLRQWPVSQFVPSLSEIELHLIK